MRAVVLVILGALAACGETHRNCGIDPGTMVVSKLDGRSGMVIGVWTDFPQLEVRFSAEQVITDTRLIGPDGPVHFSPYADVVMQCFEVEVKRSN